MDTLNTLNVIMIISLIYGPSCVIWSITIKYLIIYGKIAEEKVSKEGISSLSKTELDTLNGYLAIKMMGLRFIMFKINILSPFLIVYFVILFINDIICPASE